MKNGSIVLCYGFATAVLATNFAPTSAFAQSKTESDSAQRAKSLTNVVVTATRSATDVRDIPQKVEIIDRNAIEKTPASDVTELLKRLSTVDVIQYPTLNSGVGVRGFRPETGGLNRRTQVLIDGRPAGTGNLATIPLNNIERIEVVKGATSALYGASAMGGTINIITRKSAGPIRAGGHIGYGSFQTTNLAGYAGGNLTSKLDFDVSANDLHQGDNYRIGKGNLLRGAFGNKSATRLVNDSTIEKVRDLGDGVVRSSTQLGYRNGSARVGYDLGAGMRVDVGGELFRARGVRAPGDIIQADSGNTRKNVNRNSADVRLSGAYGRHTPTARFFSTYEDSETYDDTTSSSFINFAGRTRNQGAQVQDVFQLGNQTITTGLDYIRGTATSNRQDAPGSAIAPYSPYSRISTVGVFVQSHWRALGNRLTGTIGGRFDRARLNLLETQLRPEVTPGSRNFNTFNPSAGVQFTASDALRVHGSIGRAFIVPDANQMAGQSISGSTTVTVTAGNPDVNPESSITYDLGVGYAPRRSGFNTDLTYFHTRVSDRITSARAAFAAGSRPTTTGGQEVSTVVLYVNANRAVMQGVEAELGYDFGRLTGQRYILRAFTTATRLFTAYEYVQSTSVDGTQFAGTTDFDATDVRNALIFGTTKKNRIRNVAPLTLTTGLDYNSLGRWSGRVTGRYVGSRLDAETGTSLNILYAPFAVVDVVFGMQVAEHYRVDALINNITDENYYEKRGYNLPGRALQLRMSVAR